MSNNSLVPVQHSYSCFTTAFLKYIMKCGGSKEILTVIMARSKYES